VVEEGRCRCRDKEHLLYSSFLLFFIFLLLFFFGLFFPLEDVIILLKRVFFLYFNFIYFSYC